LSKGFKGAILNYFLPEFNGYFLSDWLSFAVRTHLCNSTSALHDENMGNVKLTETAFSV